MNKELNKIKEVVFNVMSENVQTRNNDTMLVLEVLRELGFKVYIDYSKMKDMPSLESITRSRRYWQNTKKVLLSNKQTDELRSKQENNYKDVFKR